jgi:HEPN domain-containing protein
VVSTSFELAREVLNYAKEEFEKALKLNDFFLYRNAADKVFLALVIAINAYIKVVEGVEPSSHSGRRVLRKMGREDLRALYSDLMKTLHDEVLYEGVYQPDEVEYALKKVEEILSKLEEEVRRGRNRPFLSRWWFIAVHLH